MENPDIVLMRKKNPNATEFGALPSNFLCLVIYRDESICLWGWFPSAAPEEVRISDLGCTN